MPASESGAISTVASLTSTLIMQFADPYLTDLEAQKTLTYASNKARQAGIKASFLYRLGGAGQVIDIWRVIRPDEIIAEAEIAKKLSKYVPPDYVRYQQEDGVRVAHYIRHQPPQPHRTTPPPRAEGGLALTNGGAGRPDRAATEAPTGPTGDFAEQPPARRTPPPAQRPQPGPQPRPPRPAVEVPPMEPSETQAGAAASSDDEDWVWTGTDLVRKSSATTDGAEDTEDTEDTENVKDSASAADTERTGDAEPADNIRQSERSEPPESSASADSPES